MNSTTEALIRIYDRDLTKLAEEIKLYPDEALLWKVVAGINNSAGNLAVHLCGSLQHFFGAIMAKNGYKRNRDLEFSIKGVPLSEILKEIELAREAMKSVLSRLSSEELDKEFPVVVFDQPMTTGFFLIHMTTHITYHLGQINYHRRILTKPDEKQTPTVEYRMAK